MVSESYYVLYVVSAGKPLGAYDGAAQRTEGDQTDRPQLPAHTGERHSHRNTCTTGGGETQ